MSSTYGQSVRVSVFGQSHSAGIGVVVDGLPAGEPVDLERLGAFMARRAPGNAAWSTPRKEADAPEVLAGLNPQGRTCGAPLALVIRNTNTRSQDYANIARTPRPGHADLGAQARWHGEQDVAGGGHFSGRLTACVCMAGGVALQVLERRGIRVGAHIAAVAGIADARFDPLDLAVEQLAAPAAKAFPVIDDEAGLAMQAAIAGAHAAEDSVGGVVECAVLGLPAGVGAPMFDGLENRIAQAVFGIPAVKGLEFGAGFGIAELYGSQANDPYRVAPDGRVRTTSNNNGGILGGISNGMPLVFRCAFKPTSSIGTEQQSVDLATGTDAPLTVVGRHDPCVVPRAVPVVEAACALALVDALACDGRLGPVTDADRTPDDLALLARMFGA
jgi:chorismate synthase